jgi:DNA-directed RNA polymerase subunit N (RpoN/RPB10)
VVGAPPAAHSGALADRGNGPDINCPNIFGNLGVHMILCARMFMVHPHLKWKK